MAVLTNPRHLSPATVAASLLVSGLLVSAHPYGRNDLVAAGFGYLLPRQCDNPCGIDDQYCCGGGEVCFTSSDIAGCSSADGAGHGVYVTTWTQTQTFTSTITTSWPAKETGGGGGGGGGGSGDCSPTSDGEEACGSICCASWQYCAYKGQCLPRDDVSVPVSTFTTDGQLTTQFSQPYRITSTTGTSATATGGAGGAGGAEGETGDGGGGGSGLSGGAIAGIVIGALAGVALLMLLCFCCVVRGLWAMLCGGGRDKDKERDRRRSRSRTAVTEERYSRRTGSPHSHRDHHRTWYGTRVSSPSDRARRGEKKKSRFSLWMMAIMSTLAALLFLNRNKKKKDSEKTRSTTATSRSRGYTDSSWTGSESDRTSSTGTRSNYTRRTRETRTTRYTAGSRRPRDY